MNRGFAKTLVLVGILAGVLMCGQAQAGWRHWRADYGVPYLGWTGYNYSYYGGWGCCEPAYTYSAPSWTCCDPCWGPYRVGLLGRLAYRWRAHHYGYYGGCCDPCHVSSCCTMCGCVWDDCGCGDAVIEYDSPSVFPQEEPTPADEPGTELDMQMPEKQTSLLRDGALLTVQVPAAAKVMVNGVLTRSTGEVRRYASRNLTPGFDYTYEVRAELTVGGKPVTQTQMVQLQAGQQAQLAFDLRSRQSPDTALTVHVPADAKVYLAGHATEGQGSVRTFRTTKLQEGQSWSDYVVRVVVDDQGTPRVKEEKITLRAGDQRELTFDFGIDKLAAVR